MKFLRVSIIGEYGGCLDEGMKNVMDHLVNGLSKYHEIMPLSIEHVKYSLFKDPRISFLSPSFLVKIRSFQPQIIHYVPSSGLTFFSLIRAQILGHYTSNAKIIVSCLQRTTKHRYLSRKMFSLLKPDLILVQSRKTGRVINDLGILTMFLPNGVDVEKFSPVSIRTKQKLREKYGLEDKFIILHSGHINNARNVRVLGNLVEEDTSVIMVGSTSTKADQDLIKYLKKMGVIVWRKYFKNMQEIYNLSDCYVFPVTQADASIELPLSVLEAMSCNLPVISTRFGGLSDVFEEGDGLFWVDDERSFIDRINIIKNGNFYTGTRKKILSLSWEKVCENLNRIYEVEVET